MDEITLHDHIEELINAPIFRAVRAENQRLQTEVERLQAEKKNIIAALAEILEICVEGIYELPLAIYYKSVQEIAANAMPIVAEACMDLRVDNGEA